MGAPGKICVSKKTIGHKTLVLHEMICNFSPSCYNRKQLHPHTTCGDVNDTT